MTQTFTLMNLREAELGADPLLVEQRLAEIRALRDRLGPRTYGPPDIDAFKLQGRP